MFTVSGSLVAGTEAWVPSYWRLFKDCRLVCSCTLVAREGGVLWGGGRSPPSQAWLGLTIHSLHSQRLSSLTQEMTASQTMLLTMIQSSLLLRCVRVLMSRVLGSECCVTTTSLCSMLHHCTVSVHPTPALSADHSLGTAVLHHRPARAALHWHCRSRDITGNTGSGTQHCHIGWWVPPLCTCPTHLDISL